MSNLLKSNKKLVNEWDYEKNKDIDIINITDGSSKKVWWKCDKGHSYSETIYNRVKRNNGCPYCSNHRILKGYNDFATKFPHLLNEWDYRKNDDIGIKPDNVICFGSNTKVWWKCDKGHEWYATIRSRITGSGCPFCSNNKVLKGYNDLETTNPEILQYWNYDKNSKDSPSNYSHGSTKKVWWKCPKGHEWEATIASVTNGNRCPYCANQKFLKGYNDFATKYPELLEYWDYEKNKIKPDEVFSSIKQSFWWKCDKGHSYKQSLNSKTRGNIFSCPICNKYKRISIPEKIIFFYVSKVFDEVIENFKANWLGKKEIDIFIPKLNIGIEYDGYRYHRNIDDDIQKDLLCEKNNVKLIRIREKKCPNYKSYSTKIFTENDYSQNFKYLESALINLSNILGVSFNVNIEKDLDDILKIVNIGSKNNCIAITNPEILDEWDYEKNKKMKLTPYNITNGTNLKVWWKCPNGHSYKSSIEIKINQHTKCPYCNGRKILKGFNDLASNCPELLKEWDYEKNTIIPENQSKWSLKKVWWKCPKGHSYQSTISNKVKGGGCPICSGHQVLVGYNDIATVCPDIINEWDYEKNDELDFKINNFTKGNDTKVWWKCPKGHSYFSKINDRIIKKTGCPYCAGKKVLKGFNDLKTTNPEILQYWNYDKNNLLNIIPGEITNGSHIKVWWKCDKGHEWQASVSHIVKGTRCPYCANNKILKGFNDLKTTNPELLEEWDYEKNIENGINPENITKSYSKKVWWKCDKGHSYQSYVYNKRNGYGKCPYCRKEKFNKSTE